MIVHALICLFFLLFSITADARLITEKRDGALYVKSADMQETQQLFEQYKFDKFTKLNAKYPRIYFLKLPENWETIPESDEKHLVFLKIMLPLVLHENEKVLAERKNIENMLQKIKNGADLSAPEQSVLDNLAQKYDAFTRLKGKEKNIVLRNQYVVDLLYDNISLQKQLAEIYEKYPNALPQYRLQSASQGIDLTQKELSKEQQLNAELQKNYNNNKEAIITL